MFSSVRICDVENISLDSVLDVLNCFGSMYDSVCKMDFIVEIVFGLCKINCLYFCWIVVVCVVFKVINFCDVCSKCDREVFFFVILVVI